MGHQCVVTGLEPYCQTPRQREVIQAVAQSATVSDAARLLGLSGDRRVYDVIARVKKQARSQGWQDPESVVPEGHIVSGVSSLVRSPGDDGQVVLQWVKTRQDAELADKLLAEAREAMVEGLGRTKPVKLKAKSQPADLLNLYILTDYHLGMKSWREETGADWDIRIAEDLILAWFGSAIKDAPAAETAVFGQLGDFLHWDGLEAVTPTSGHSLDADTRFQKMVRVAIRVTRQIVKLLLQKHKHVHLIMAEGNHDLAASAWLREMLAEWYGDEPRITVDRSPDPFYCYEHGDTSLFFHHGHRKKMAQIDDVFASKFRPVFGRTKHSYAHMGHLHHDKALETNLMHVEQHRTLAAPDAYASSHGFMSGRSAPVITYSKQYGEVGRLTRSPEMVL